VWVEHATIIDSLLVADNLTGSGVLDVILDLGNQESVFEL